MLHEEHIVHTPHKILTIKMFLQEEVFN